MSKMKHKNNVRVKKWFIHFNSELGHRDALYIFLWLFTKEDHQVVTYIHVKSNGNKQEKYVNETMIPFSNLD